MPPWILVTPASRGLGLSLARRLLRSTSLPVVVTARGSLSETKEAILRAETQRQGHPNETIDERDARRLHVLKLDFTDEQSIADAASQCRALFPTSSRPKDATRTESWHLHLALVIPGILFPEKSPLQLDVDNITKTFQINTISHLLMLKHFHQFLPRKSTSLENTVPSIQGLSSRHAIWATMSARVGSISDNGLGGWYSYRSSKAAVNQITKTFDNYLKTTAGDKAMAVSLHPGTVKTEFSKEFWSGVQEGKLFEPELSAQKLCNVLQDLNIQDRGKCWDWAGKEVPP